MIYLLDNVVEFSDKEYNMKIKPINAEALYLTNSQIKMLGEVKTTSIFEQEDKLHPDGLYSQEIFGNLGSKNRLSTPGYIDLTIRIIVPVLWDYFLSLNSLHGRIAKGTVSVKLVKGELIVDSNGKTGIGYLYSIIEKIKFKESDSSERKDKIKFIRKEFKAGRGWIDKLLVYPAGLRELTFKDKRPVEEEVNDLYKAIITTSRATVNLSDKNVLNSEVDPIVERLQTRVYDIYQYFIDINNGKYKFLRTKWTSRGVTWSTRNVITGQKTDITSLKDLKLVPSLNTLVIGVLQASVAHAPVVLGILRKLLSSVMIDNNFMVIDDHKYNMVKLTGKEADIWLNPDSHIKIIHRLSKRFNKIVTIDGKPLFGFNVIDGNFKMYGLYDNIPLNVEYMTYGQLFTYILHKLNANLLGVSTRYPTTGRGSTLPYKLLIKPTIKVRFIKIDGIKVRFPMDGEDPFMSMHIPYDRLGAAGGDHDGDKMTYNAVNTREAIDEINRLFNSIKYYIDGSGKFDAVMDYDSINNIVITLSKTMRG